MEQDDRKKKLAAGKEKLAAFRKKRAKKKKDESDNHTQSFDSTQNSSTNDLEVSNTSVASVSLPDLQSFTAEIDQYSLTSGDEWSAEELDMQSSVHYQTKLAAATERIAELEEAVEGKQMALDKMVMEVQMTDPSQKMTEEILQDGECYKGSMSELQDALVQRDKIIRQLTCHLQQTALTQASGTEDVDPVLCAQETQRLSQQVGLLQQQLTQAGERVEQQAAICQMSVGALQEAKAQILSLQSVVAEKNSTLQQLSTALTARTSEVSSLRHREQELQKLVTTLQQQADDTGSDNLKAAQSAATRVVSLEQELEKLTSEHAQSTQAVLDLGQKLEASQAAHQALVNEKELALTKIAGLEDELSQLALAKDEAMSKMAALEQQVQEDSVLIQAHTDSRAIEAGERITQLEQQIAEFKENHQVQVNQLEQSLALSSETSEVDMQGLRNIINTQQGELVSLREQLKEKEDDLASSRQQLQSLNNQLEHSQTRYEQEKCESATAIHNFQQQLQVLRDENSGYQQQIALVQEQISSFREYLHFSSQSQDSSSGDASTDRVGIDSDMASQIKQLQTCYTNLLEQYTETVEKKINPTQSEMHTSVQASSHLESLATEHKDIPDVRAAEVTQLQSEVIELKASINKKDDEIAELRGKLQSVSEEKNRLAVLVEEQEQVTEQQTLQSDTLQRRMESRVNSLFTEVTEYKEALKESEMANNELQDKFDLRLKEVDSLKLQLAASEDLMKDLQNRLNAQGDKEQQTAIDLQRQVYEMTHSLSQLREELQSKENSVSWLQDQLKERDSAHSHIQKTLLEKESCLSELQDELQEKDSVVSQLQKQLQEKDSVFSQLQKQLQEKDSVISQLQEQLQEKDSVVSQLQEQLQEKDSVVSQLQEQLQEKDSVVSQLQEQLQEKDSVVSQLQEKDNVVSQLQEQLQEKDSVISQLQEHLQEKDIAVSKLQEQALEKDNSLSQLQEQLQEQIEGKNSAVSQLQDQLSEKVESLVQIQKHVDDKDASLSQFQKVLEEKENTVLQLKEQFELKNQELETLRNELDATAEEARQQKVQLLDDAERLRQQLAEVHEQHQAALVDFQEKLEQSQEQHQSVLSEKQELCGQQLAATERQAELEEQLKVKAQEYEILLSENEALREELQSSSSAFTKENKCLKVELSQQSTKLDMLMSELDVYQDKLVSRDAESDHQLHKAQEKLKENAKEMEALKAELKNMEDDSVLKETSMTNLQTEVDSLKEKVTQAESAHDAESQDRDQMMEALNSRVCELEKELQTSKDEQEVMTSKLAAQADMFRVKQEEMVAENNDLNHQLEEVRNDTQETIHGLQEQLEDLNKQLNEKASRLESQEQELTQMKEELLTSKTSLQMQEDELDTLREEDSHHKDSLASLKGSNDALLQEKEGLLAKIQSLESSIEEIQKQSDEAIAALHSEIQQLREEKHLQLSDFEKEKSLLTEQSTSLHEQLDSCTLEIERLQKSLTDAATEQETLKTGNCQLQQQVDSLQLDFTTQMDQAQSELAAKDTELQSVQTKLKDSTELFTRQIESLQEEIAAAQSEIDQKESSLNCTMEELTTTKQQLDHTQEEKEMLKSNFDCCMEDMSRRTTEKDTVIQQLQGRLIEASNNVDRDHSQLREMYESQLSELEDRLAAADLETQRLEKLTDTLSSEKDKLRDNYNSHVAELELTVQAAESEASHLKEQMAKTSSTLEKELADLKQSSELQLSSLEENCQSLEKTLAKQEALLTEANNKYERERGEREKSFDQQLSEAYEQARMYEMDISRLKRQMDEMRKDHQKELQETHKTLEDQVFDLENKCAITTSEMERLRQSLWGMEQDHSAETQSMCQRTQELESLAHSQEKQISELQEKLAQSSQLSDDSMTSLRECHQTDVAHLHQVNQRLKEDVDRLQAQLKATHTTHRHEMEALQHQYTHNTLELQEKCRQAENYSSVLQSHMESASPQKSRDPQCDILQEEVKRLQEELVGAESSISVLKQQLKEAQASNRTRVLAGNSFSLQGVSGQEFIEDSSDKEKKYAGFITEGGFEPEPDSLEYLDLATGCNSKEEGDYFVEETESNHSPKMRNKSVPSEAYLEAATASEQNLSAQQQKRSSAVKDSDRDDAGRFEPDVDEGAFEYSDGLRSEPVKGSFQPESVPVSPSMQGPFSAPNPSFLPDPMGALAVARAQVPARELVHATSQTDLPLEDGFPAETGEPPQTDSAGGAQESSPLSEDDKTAVDAEVSRQVRGVQDQLEEEWVQKMRLQEVDLRQEYENKFGEYKRQVEHSCEQRVRNIKQDTQASFVDAVRKMRKSLERKQRQQDREVDSMAAARIPPGAKTGTAHQALQDTNDDEKLGDIVKQLHEENQELAEVRDVLLQQIAISQTQGRRHAMQHELQAKVAGGSRLSPQSTISLPQPLLPLDPDSEEPIQLEQLQAVHTAATCTSGRHPHLPSTDTDSAGQSTPLAGSDDDDDDDRGGDDESDSSCVRERFLEELEEMSQQSGQDLPLEWELTSAAVTVSDPGGSGVGTGIFEQDQLGGQSVWEVFDGRCLRQDCRELESVKQQYEAEMEALRQELEGQHKHQHSHHVDQQLHSQFMQAVSSLREALQDSSQQKELDAVVGQLQEIHQQQLQQMQAQHRQETALQVTAMRVTVEQVQESRVRLLQEQHSSTVQSLHKAHKEELSALQAHQAPNNSQDGVSPLAANEELTQQYQKLVRRISQTLEKEVLGRLCGGEENKQAEQAEEAKTNGNGVLSDDSDEVDTRHAASHSAISKEQADAIQQALEAQQEEVLLLRSKLLHDYEGFLQQRTDGVSQQSQQVQQLQDDMAALQRQYQQQIEQFQAKLSLQQEEEERRQAEQQQHRQAMEEMKAKYEQRIVDMEESFSKQIIRLQQQQQAAMALATGRTRNPQEPTDGGDSAGLADPDKDQDSLSLRLEAERDYVHRTATLTAVSDVESDTADSPRSTAGSRLLQLEQALEDKTVRVSELEQQLEEDREKMRQLIGQLDSASQQLSELSGQLEDQQHRAETLQARLKERDEELEQALEDQAESEKLLSELTSKETSLQKENDNLQEELKCLKELDDTLLTSTPTVEDELKQLRLSLEETTSALRTVEAREGELRDKLMEADHQHANALEELRQELEHEAQVERETLQSEFLVQLDVELKRQAAQLLRQQGQSSSEDIPHSSNQQQAAHCPENIAHSVRMEDENDTGCVPDGPHIEDSVQAAVVATVNMTPCVAASDGSDPQQSEAQQSSVFPQHNSASRDISSPGQDDTEPQAAVTVGDSPISSGACGDEEKAMIAMSELDKRLQEQQKKYEEEKAQLVTVHSNKLEELNALLTDAQEKYDRLKEAVEEKEGVGVEVLVKDRYDMELELAKNLMQQEFDDTLQAEKKKFVERHRQLMDEFMADQEEDAKETKARHEQEMEDLRSSITTQFTSQIADLQAQLTLSQTSMESYQKEKGSEEAPEKSAKTDCTSEVDRLKGELEEEKQRLELVESDYGQALTELDGVKEELNRARKEQVEAAAALLDARAQLDTLTTDHSKALASLSQQHQATIAELKQQHQAEMEAAALDTDVVRSELEHAHQAELEVLKGRLAAAEQQQQHGEDTTATSTQQETQTETVTATKETGTTAASSPLREIMQHIIDEQGNRREGGREGELTPDLRSSLEYETTDEEGSIHSFSSLVGVKSKTTADAVTSPPPSASSTSTPQQQEQRIKQLEAQVEELIQQLAEQQQQQQEAEQEKDSTLTPTRSALLASPASTLTSSPALSGAMAAAASPQAWDGGDHNLLQMLQQDLDRLSTERDTIQQTNNRLLQLLSDSVHTYVEVEDSINRRLHTITNSASPAPRPHTPTHSARSDLHGDLATPKGAGLSSFMGMAGDRGAVGGLPGMAVSSPQSDHSWRQRDADTSSPTLEETSILSSATDEGLDISQRLTESIFTGPDIDAEGEEIVSDARGRLQGAVQRLLEMLERTTQQMMEARNTQTQLLDTMAQRSQHTDDLRTRLNDLQDQLRQEVAAKEYLGMELHKAEGLVSGYSSEREALEEQVQSLEEQKEVMASELETTRSRLLDFQQATGELEARRLDVERQQTLLQDNAGHETQALLKEMDMVKQQTREQTLQLQHRLTQAEHRLQEKESSLEEAEKEHQRQTEDLRRQLEDVRLQLDNTDRQLKANKQFLDEQLTEREQEREEFLREVDRLKGQLQDQGKHSDSEARLQREIQDLTEQLQARIDSQSLMHQQTVQLQQSLEERELSAQDLRTWINSLEKELDQRGDTEQQLKGRIDRLERRLTIGDGDNLSDTSASPVATPRPESPSNPLSPPRPSPQRRQSRISLEEELRKSRQTEEELVHEREALQKRVQEQLLQISALRNQLDEMRHWTGTPDPNASSSSAVDLREQLEAQQEKLEKAEEEVVTGRGEQERLQAEVDAQSQEVEELRQQLKEAHTAGARLAEVEQQRDALQARVEELSSVGPFPPELLDEKNAEIEELRNKLEATETSLAQELDQTVGEQEARLTELTAEVNQLTQDNQALQAELAQRDDHLSQVQEEKNQKHEALLEKESDLQQMVEQISSMHTEISNLTAFQDELQKDFDTVQAMLDEKEKEIESLTKELESRSQTDGSDVSEPLRSELESVKRQLSEQSSQVSEQQRRIGELEEELSAKEQEVERQLSEQSTQVSEQQRRIGELEEQVSAKEQEVEKQLSEQSSQVSEQQRRIGELEEQVSAKEQEVERQVKSRTDLELELSQRLEELEKERKLRLELQQDSQTQALQEQVCELEEALRLREGEVKQLQEAQAKALEDRDRDMDTLTQQLQQQETDLTQHRQQQETESQQHEEELTSLRQQVQAKEDCVQQLQSSQQTLQHQAQDQLTTISRLQTERDLLTQQLEEAKRESVATDDVKSLQEKLQGAWQQASELQQQVSHTQTRLDQTSAQLMEREEQIQQLQTELQTAQQESQRLRESQLPGAEGSSTGAKTPESEDSETEEQLSGVQSAVHDSLSCSLPIPSTSNPAGLSRWESEPGLTSSISPLEKEALITSLRRELGEARQLLTKAERASSGWSREGGDGDAPPPAISQSLSPQTKQQIAHLRSELRRAQAALAAMQHGHNVSLAAHRGSLRSEVDGGEVQGDQERLERLEAELMVMRSASSTSADDYIKKLEEVREELGREHQRHVREVQETARQDLERQLGELQLRQEQETQQLEAMHARKLAQALDHQRQELQDQHITQLNALRVDHQAEIDRLRSDELASLTESSVAQELNADILATQQMDQHMIGQLTSPNGASDATNDISHPCPPRIQTLLDRLREQGEHILSVSELDLLRRHLSPGDSGLQEAWEGEKLTLVRTVHALKDLLSQADHTRQGLEEDGSDWRCELIQALVEVYKKERLAMEAELHTLRLQHPLQHNADAIKNWDNRLQEQEQLHQSGLDAMLRAERQSLLGELESLQTRLSQQRQQQQELQDQLTSALNQHQDNTSNATWKLQREVQVLEYKLKEGKVIEEDLRKGVESERRRVAELSSELSRDKGALITAQAELQSTQLQLARARDALEREQSRFTSVTDALEEEREKNSRLADMLETLRRQHTTLESDIGRSESLRRERENAETKFIKDLQTELVGEREQLQKAVEVGEEERRQRKQVEGELQREQQHATALEQELDRLRRSTKKALDQEAAKLAEANRLVQQRQEEVQALERSLADKEAALLHSSHQAHQLQAQVDQLKQRCETLQRDVELEGQKSESLVGLMDSERQQQLKMQQQELTYTKQLRKDLALAKNEASDMRRQLEVEKSHGDSLRLELERSQSEVRVLSQHAGDTEKQLQSQQSKTWTKLQMAQKERDQLQVKVHELEQEMDRLQDKLRDLELEVDRSRQRELEARHSVERHKLFTAASPRSGPNTPRGVADPQLQLRLNAFCQQLQRMGGRLQTLTLKQRDLNVSSVSEAQGSGSETNKEVDTLVAELKALQHKMASGQQIPVQVEAGEASSIAAGLKQQVDDLQSTIRQLRDERNDLHRQLTLLQDRDNERRTPRTPRSGRTLTTRQKETMPQYVSDVATSDEEVVCERTIWASERLKLQLALDSAEHEIDRLKKELRSFRGHFNSEGFMVEADREKMQRLYGKYLRAESFRKALVYQKRYLLLLLGGYQDSEQETLAIIATMGGQPSSTLELAMRRRHRRLYTMFRSAARMVVAIFRMKYLVRKWKRAMRVGSPVVTGQINLQHGYMATAQSFSPHTERQQAGCSTATASFVHTVQRHNSPGLNTQGLNASGLNVPGHNAQGHNTQGHNTQGHNNAPGHNNTQGHNTVCNGGDWVGVSATSLPYPASSRAGGEMGRPYSTPPTKEFSQAQRVPLSPAASSSNSARRQLLGELEGSQHSGSGSDLGAGAVGGGAAAAAALVNTHDDYIQRLENLRTRLSATKNGDVGSPRHSSWR